MEAAAIALAIIIFCLLAAGYYLIIFRRELFEGDPEHISLFEFEGTLDNLSLVMVVSKEFLVPEGDSRETVMVRMARWRTKYVFLTSDMSQHRAEDTLLRFKEIATEAIDKYEIEDVTPDQLVEMKMLRDEWNFPPYVFYRYRDEEGRSRTVAIRGIGGYGPICKVYERVNPEDAAPLFATLLGEAPESVQQLRLQDESLSSSFLGPMEVNMRRAAGG